MRQTPAGDSEEDSGGGRSPRRGWLGVGLILVVAFIIALLATQ